MELIPAHQKRQIYLIDSIEVIGLKSFNPQTVISYSGLRKGQTIQFPGDQVSSVINKLWNLDLFSDINFYVTKIAGDQASIEINVTELPSLSDYKITGLRKAKAETMPKTQLTTRKTDKKILKIIKNMKTIEKL